MDDGGSGPFDPRTSAISGTFFYDANRNGVFDGSETLIDQYAELSPSGSIIGSQRGTLSFFRADGSYSLSALPSKYWDITTPSTIDFDIVNGISSKTLSFGLAPAIAGTDISVQIVGRAARALFDTRYWITIANNGDAAGASSLKLSFKYSELLDYKSASVPPFSHENNTLTWNLQDLAPLQEQQFVVDFKVIQGPNFIGDTIKNYVEAKIENGLPDIDTTNNVMSFKPGNNRSLRPKRQKRKYRNFAGGIYPYRQRTVLYNPLPKYRNRYCLQCYDNRYSRTFNGFAKPQDFVKQPLIFF
jgi:hypothetical protein